MGLSQHQAKNREMTQVLTKYGYETLANVAARETTAYVNV
jgi:hypothetical protein|tara:strand:- start:533 stop:652 length:120 start_codon:yes stop_codon:yes gene_type:complete